MMKSAKPYLLLVACSLFVSSFCTNCRGEKITIDYFGQAPPTQAPEKFAPGLISTIDGNEYGGHFSPDGKEFYFTRFYESEKAQILFCSYEKGAWSEPRPVSFMKDFRGGESCLSPDGSKLFFMREFHRPDTMENDFFVAERVGNDWAQPKAVSDIDLGERRVCPSVAQNLNLYYSGNLDNPEDKDIYVSRFVDGEYQAPQNLGPAINSPSFEQHVYIAPDERYIMFDSDRPEGFGGGDIYISFPQKDGTWSEAINLGKPINSEIWDWYPYVTPDGEYIIFARSGTNGIDLYWYGAEFLNKLKAK